VPLVSSAGEQDEIHAAADGAGGAIVVWNDYRNGIQDQIYAQRYAGDGPTAVAVSLVSVDAAPDRVSLTWQRAGGSGGAATIYRRTASESWRALGSASFDGVGRLHYEDATVTAGTRYAYRLGVTTNGVEDFSAESWVDVPAALEFALEGLRPNPAVAELRGPLEVAASFLGTAPRHEHAALARRVVRGPEAVVRGGEERFGSREVAARGEREGHVGLRHPDRAPVAAAPAELERLLEERQPEIRLAERARTVPERAERVRLAALVAQLPEAQERLVEQRAGLVLSTLAAGEHRQIREAVRLGRPAREAVKVHDRAAAGVLQAPQAGWRSRT